MPSRRVSVRETMNRDGPRISFIMEIDNGARLFDAIDSVILFPFFSLFMRAFTGWRSVTGNLG